MRRHQWFEATPRGYRFYAVNAHEGLWLPLPIYWVAYGIRDLQILWMYFRIMLTKKEK